ncbi:hypothetical protein ACWDKQ_33820 [Saccharopolyspora sp. NPDC000995]
MIVPGDRCWPQQRRFRWPFALSEAQAPLPNPPGGNDHLGHPAQHPIDLYRIVHHGDWKNGWNGSITAFTGATRPFLVS